MARKDNDRLTSAEAQRLNLPLRCPVSNDPVIWYRVTPAPSSALRVLAGR